MQRTQIYLTPAEAKGVARLAADTGRKRSHVIREAINPYLQRHDPGDRLAKLRQARGIWRGRGLSLEDIRQDFERFSPSSGKNKQRYHDKQSRYIRLRGDSPESDSCRNPQK